ncbi:MAG: hypothetical protein R3F56_21545 [Planctomycetota bacterium]
MRDLFVCLALCAIVGHGRVLSAQVKIDEGACPHQVVERIPGAILAGNSVRCGSGVEWNFGSVRYTSPANVCTLLLTYTPEHYLTKPSPGSNTYTEPSGRVPVYVGRYQCRTTHFLFLPIGSTCEEVSFTEAYRVPSYVQHRCRD